MKAALFLSIYPIIWAAQLVLVYGQDVTLVTGPSKEAGVYRVTLRLPADGLVAGEEQQIELRIVDTSIKDPVLGPPPVIRALVQATISMPVMPSMPKAEEIAHPEGVPGEYGLHPSFAHGGDYLLNVKIKPRRGEAFNVGFQLNVADEIPHRQFRPRPYKIELETDPRRIRAGEATRLKFVVWANRELRDPDGRPNGKRRMEQVKAFEAVHQKQMHLIVARRDLGFFAHTHPELQGDGSFLLSGYTFPTQGEYQLFVDVAPLSAGAQVLLTNLKVEGGPRPETAPLQASRGISERTVSNVIVSVADNEALTAKRTAQFKVTLRQTGDGAPVTRLQPYLGAFAHLLMIHEDAQTFVHAHPDPREAENGANGARGSLSFLVRPPKAGLYRAWIEFQLEEGKIERTDFILEAKEAGSAHR
jgi:hypothetical protein